MLKINYRFPALSQINARIRSKLAPVPGNGVGSQETRLAPQGTSSSDVLELAASIPLIPSKRKFLQRIDEFQQTRLGDLAIAYDNVGLAKLVLIKVGNLLVLTHGIHHRHTQLASRPTQIKLDPSNTCQLQCPGCVHGDTPSSFDWPKGVMEAETFDRIMSDYGPFAFAALMYYYGEPLINKQFPQMVRRAKSLGLYAWTSSNLSLSFDVDAVVASGLDLMTMSIDGISQETLEFYRRRGKYDLCLANMHALVAAKRRLGHGPYLSWQFLTFEHNSHEIDAAIALAKEIGVDELHVATPNDVTWDDPTVRIHTSERAGRYVFNEDAHLFPSTATAPIGIDEAACDRLLAESWVERMDRIGIAEEPSRPGRATCDWLYQNATFDSADRVMPCCMAPSQEAHVHFANLDAAGDDPTNSDAFRRARLSFADRAAYDAEARSAPGRAPYCAECTAAPTLGFPLSVSVGPQLRSLDRGRAFDEPAIAALTS